MANTFTMTKNYDDGTLLLADDLDQMAFSLEAFLNTTKVNDDNIQDAGLIGANIAPASVTTASLATNSITTAKIQDQAVTSSKIADLNVTSAKIIDGEITRDKLEDVGQQIFDFDTVVNSGSSAEVTLTSVTITTTGRPVYILTPALPFSSATIGVGDNSYEQGASPSPSATTTNLNYSVHIYRDATKIYSTNFRMVSTYPPGASTFERRLRMPVGGVQTIDSPTAGTYTYTLKMNLNTTTMAGKGRGELVAFEL